MNDKHRSTDDGADFAREAHGASTSIFREFWDFLCVSRKWWLTPILIVLLLVGLLVVASSTGLAPFIYTLF
jgi:hypothetical protein